MIDAPEMRQAEQLVRRADANQAEHGRRWTPDDHARWVARRRGELASKPTRPGDPEHQAREHQLMIAAGIDPARYEAATAAERQELLDRAQRAQQAQRDLLRSVPADGDMPRPDRADLRALRRHVHDHEWRRARTQQRRAIQRDAWRRRARENLYRTRR
jgi:hypothetical protein